MYAIVEAGGRQYKVIEGKNILNLRGGDLKNLRQEMQVIFQDPYGSL
jgi:ABC-type microcin C transport system duplicated ATPase subunit YejF